MHDPNSLYTQMWEASPYELGLEQTPAVETVISRARRAVAYPRPCPEGRSMGTGITDKLSLLTYASHLSSCLTCRRAWGGSATFVKGLAVSLCQKGEWYFDCIARKVPDSHEAYLAFREHLRTCPTCGHPRICALGETLVSLMQDAAQSLDFDEAAFNARVEAVTQHGHTCPQCAAVLSVGPGPVSQTEPDYAYKTTLAGHLKSFWSK